MFIRVEKCSTFGIKKTLTKSVQYLPKLLINNQVIPKINIGEAFQYLGRYFSFNMSDEQHKSELTSLVEDLMADIDSKPIHPKNKILLYSRYLLSKLSWHFTVSSLSKTWVIENIDTKVNSYIRKWLDIPISGTLSTIFLTRNKFGLNICPPSVKFIQCQTVLRKALKTSPDESINELWKATSNSKNIQYDTYNSTKQVLKDFRSGQEDKLRNQLTCQGYQHHKVLSFPTHQNLVGVSIKPPEKHIQLHNTIHQQLSSNPPKPFQMGLITNVRLSKMPSSRNTSTHSSWLSILPRTRRHNSILHFLATNLQTVNGSCQSVCHHW